MHFTYENGQIIMRTYTQQELLLEAEEISRKYFKCGHKDAWAIVQSEYDGTSVQAQLKSIRFLLGLKSGDNWPRMFVPKFKDDGRETLSSKFMKFAIDLAAESTCERKKVGTVVTDFRHERILCIGYNGNHCGGPNRCENPNNPGNCGCVHSEQNALIKSNETLRNSICYVTLSPCRQCSKLLINSGISKVIYFEEYRDTSSLELLCSAGVEVEKF